MKKLFFFALAALALAACSDDELTPGPVICPPEPEEAVCPESHVEVLSFESTEGLRDIEGQAVLLGDVTVVGTAVAGTYPNVFWAKSVSNFDSYLEADAYGGSFYDGFLFSTANENIWIGTRFSTSSYGDYWGGFVATANAGRTAVAVDYKNQFTVWASHAGANGTATSLIGYDDAYTFEYGGGTYARPTIELAKQPRTVCHCYMANTAIGYNYIPEMVEADKYYCRVVAVGSLDGAETGRVTCTLVEGAGKVSGWKKFDLTPLGKVDKITFAVESNDFNENGLLAPTYFAVDEIGFVADK